MRPGRRNLEITRGDDYAHTIEFVLAGVPVDMSSSSFAAQIRDTPDAATAVAFDVDSSQLAAGVLVLSLPASKTRTLSASASWDLQQASPGARITTILKGLVSVGPDVTR